MFWSNPRKDAERSQKLSEMSPVILMGRGKSGTRILSFMSVKLGLQFGTSGELATGDADDQKFTDEIKRIAFRNVGVVKLSEVDDKELVKFQKCVEAYHDRHAMAAEMWGWKFPETYMLAPFIEQTFPKARYLHLVRDGRDLAFKNHLSDDPNRKFGRKILERLKVMDQPHHVQAAVSWGYQVDNFDAFRSEIGAAAAGRIFDTTFEEMCANPRSVAEALCAFMGIDMTPECEEYLSQSVKTTNIAAYKQQPEALIEEATSRIRPTLKRYGYV